MITTLFIIVGTLLLAMIGSVVLDPRSSRSARGTEETAEEQARMMEAIANSVF
jgi:ABC-type bacteriocin/lantibiotic exporter with double-glycine peptidase domain